MAGRRFPELAHDSTCRRLTREPLGRSVPLPVKKKSHVLCHAFRRRARESNPAGFARAHAVERCPAAADRNPSCLAGGVCGALGIGLRFEGAIHRQLCPRASAQRRRRGCGAFLSVAKGGSAYRQQHQARCRRASSTYSALRAEVCRTHSRSCRARPRPERKGPRSR